MREHVGLIVLILQVSRWFYFRLLKRIPCYATAAVRSTSELLLCRYSRSLLFSLRFLSCLGYVLHSFLYFIYVFSFLFRSFLHFFLLSLILLHLESIHTFNTLAWGRPSGNKHFIYNHSKSRWGKKKKKTLLSRKVSIVAWTLQVFSIRKRTDGS